MSAHSKSYARPTTVAGLVLLLGTVASLAINAKAISLTDKPETGAYISGLAWPIALLVVIELMIHTPWMDNWRDRSTKGAALIVVGGVAAWISYSHGVHVLAHWHYDFVGQHAGPLVADVAMAVATLALHRVGHAKRMATVASGQQVVASPPAVASGQNRVATVATIELPAREAMAELAKDWATVASDLDADLAALAKNAPAATPSPATDRPSSLTTVPELAAKRIREALDAQASKAELVELDEALAADGIAGSPRTARRWRAAVANGTERVS